MRLLSILTGTPDSLLIPAWEDPWAWMRRRLRVTFGIGLILLLVQTVSALHEAPGPPVMSSSVVTKYLLASGNPTSVRAAQLSGQPLSGQPLSGLPRSVLPRGWRRTASGWQHVSTWSTAVPIRRLSLGEQILAQRAAEPVWLRTAMHSFRRTPPGCFALAQLLGVGVLFLVFVGFHRGGVTKRVHRTGDTSFVSPTGLAR